MRTRLGLNQGPIPHSAFIGQLLPRCWLACGSSTCQRPRLGIGTRFLICNARRESLDLEHLAPQPALKALNSAARRGEKIAKDDALAGDDTRIDDLTAASEPAAAVGTAQPYLRAGGGTPQLHVFPRLSQFRNLSTLLEETMPLFNLSVVEMRADPDRVGKDRDAARRDRAPRRHWPNGRAVDAVHTLNRIKQLRHTARQVGWG